MSYKDNEPLFQDGDLRERLDQHFDRIQEKVDAVPKQQFLGTSDEELYQHIFDSFLVRPLELHESSREMDSPEETEIDVTGWPEYGNSMDDEPILVPGVRVTIWIPYTGDDLLWDLRPHSLWTIGSRGSVKLPEAGSPGYLTLVISQPTTGSVDEIQRTLEEMLHPIRETLAAQKSEIEMRNAQLPERIRAGLTKRREALGVHSEIQKALSIPLRRRPGAPSITPVPLKKRFVKPLPIAKAASAEPGIATEDYEYILSVLRHVGCTFEATPRTYAPHDEEELRDILLAHLNGHFLGGATGETFRKQGKTDIRIEDTNRAAFVAECKMWRGAAEFHKAIDQLQDYLTWRDCKASLIVFNQANSRFADIQQQVPGLFREHPGYENELSTGKAGEWRFIIQSHEDPMRKLIVHVLLFNLYVADRAAG